MPASSAATERVVVAVAIVADGRVLAARRAEPPGLAGGWELAGGKLEPGETLAEAGKREVREELGCEVRVVGVLPGSQPLSEGYVLRVVVGQLVSGEPLPVEHDAVRWLSTEDLEEVAWLPADLPFLAPVRELLRS